MRVCWSPWILDPFDGRPSSPPIGFGLRWLTAGGWAWWRPGPGRSGCWDGWDRACGPGHQRGAGRAAAVATQDATGEPRASGCDHVERAQRQPDGAGGSPAPRARPDRHALPVDRACAGEPADRVRCGDAALRARGAGTGAGRGTARRTGGADPGSEPGPPSGTRSSCWPCAGASVRCPLAWRVEETLGSIGFAVQQQLLDTVAAWLPEAARVRLLGDRFYGTPALIAHCQALDWDYRLRLKGNLRAWIDGADAGSVEQLARCTPYLTGVELTARRVRTNVGFIQDPGHEEPWIIAMSEIPGYLTTLDYARRWGIEPMFSDFKTRGFGLEDSQIRHPDRLARLILVMTLALYLAVSTGQWDALHHATPAERRRPDQQPKRVLRSMTSWFTRGLRRIANLLQTLQPFPQLWSAAATDRW